MQDIVYEGRVFRPPSEAYSLIVQSTIGCSHNSCAFCQMYKEKRFRVRTVEDVLQDLRSAQQQYTPRRIFLADGDAFMRTAAEQCRLLAGLYDIYPGCERVSMYASPRSILVKSDRELADIFKAGASLLYMGLESGDDALLSKVNKGATAADIIEAARRAKAAGFTISVTGINGLAGADKAASLAHASATAKAVSAMQPDYFSLLTLMLEPGSDMFNDFRSGSFVPLSAEGILWETRAFLSEVDSEGTVFRANHASNYLTLAGTLNKDRTALLNKLDSALAGASPVRRESWRRL